jgi:hypothetical protein
MKCLLIVIIVIYVNISVGLLLASTGQAQQSTEKQPDATPPDPSIQSESPVAFLKVLKVLNNTSEGPPPGTLPRPNDFEIGLYVFTDGLLYQHLTDFPGSEKGWILTFQVNTQYNIKESIGQWNGYLDSYSSDCQGIIRLGENKTCIVTNTYNSTL